MRDEEILYELGHYLADNLIAKSCIYVALANKKEELIYPSKNKDFTKKFPILYKDFLEKYFDVPNYEDCIKSYHKQRNIYQHDVDSLVMTMRHEDAKQYVRIGEKILRETEIIGRNEKVYAMSLTSGYNEYEKRRAQSERDKFQELYELIKNSNQENYHIKLRHKFEDVGISTFKHILEMEGSNYYSGFTNFYNDKWSIIHHGKYRFVITKIIQKSKNLNEEDYKYTSEYPDEKRHILEEFLEYFIKKCSEQGININP